MTTQLCFDFDAAVTVVAKARRIAKPGRTSSPAEAEARRIAEYWAARDVEARAIWKVGMVASLPCMAEIEGVGLLYTMMLPSVIESINGDIASARIYAAPEWGYTLEEYPLHLKLAINIRLRDLFANYMNKQLQQVIDRGLLATGCAALGTSVRQKVIANRALADSI